MRGYLRVRGRDSIFMEADLGHWAQQCFAQPQYKQRREEEPDVRGQETHYISRVNQAESGSIMTSLISLFLSETLCLLRHVRIADNNLTTKRLK